MRTLIQFEAENEEDIPNRLLEIADNLKNGDAYDLDNVKIVHGDGVKIDPRLTMAAANLMMAFDMPQPAEQAMAQMLYAVLLHPGMTTGDMGLKNPESLNSMSKASMIAKALSLIEDVKAEKN